ncbi:CLUMA_CG002617, isoform A [Clunio marinus]|uniref:CLUMA_CG002617, isoform A n=1 Tax=Clunio marinus TaxID=568069 RepID=A0A1J1HLV9_9DIPT|nr:CLUMA_CG002617, isoform A [Clunio marinus]
MKDRHQESLDIRKRSIFSSSAESLTSFDDSLSITTQEQLFENIRLHKEIIQSVKNQPWSLSKKYKIVQKAKQYVSRHEDTLQERFAQSGNTKDLYARFKIVLADVKILKNVFYIPPVKQKLKHMKREIYNYAALLIPWEIRIKEIESRFGSVVASYFIFLRWLFWVNIVIANIFTLFVIVPEVIGADPKKNEDPELVVRKVMLDDEKKVASNFLTVWDFEGYLKYSPLFYGYYSNSSVGFGYQLPMAYFLAGLVVYIYSFFATLRKMAKNSRNAKLGSKEDECVFSWKLFTGWDFMIGHSETAANRIASVVMGFKEALLEEAEKQKDKKNWKIICLRIIANLSVLFLLCVSAYAVIWVVKRSSEKNDSWWRRNEITVVMSMISFIFPMLFELLGLMEYYHPRMQLRLQLARIMILNLLNLYSLIWALFGKINGMTARLGQIKSSQDNITSTTSSPSVTFKPIPPVTQTPSYFDIPSSTVESITDSVYTKITEILNQTTTEYPTDPTESYDYSNTNYFEYEEPDTQISTTVETSTIETIMNFTESLFDFTDPFYIDNDFGNYTDFYTNTTGDLFINSNFNMSNLINPSGFNDSPAVNYTNIEPIASALEGFQYSFLQTDQSSFINNDLLNSSTQLELRKLCWETMFGQELVKLTVMDLLLTVMQIMILDFFRALFVRYMNSCWCWDLEKRFPKYGDFKIAENILHLVNNQGMVWMGMFFSPGLAILNLIKLVLILYLRSWAVLTCNVPHEVVFRASRSNNFYLTLLLTMLFLCVLPVSYAIVWLEPSLHCGPFSGYERMYYLFTDTVKGIMPSQSHKFLEYIVSPAAIIPLLLLLILFIYYLISLTGALRMANQDLKTQLHKERTEERKKMMRLMEDKLMDSVNVTNKLSNRWKKVLEVPKPASLMTPSITATLTPEETDDRKKMLLARAMKNILRKKYSNEDDPKPKITTEIAQP